MMDHGETGGWHPGHSPWAIALTVTLATFMEVLDTSIANVALPHIAGGLAATANEATWVLTSYLVSNAIVLPVSGWLAVRFGRKRFYMTCVVLFTVSSLLCGLASSLGMLIFFRVLQGAGGGGLAPSEQSILADTFAPARRGMAFGIYGMAVVVPPAVGPTLGGWLTDGAGWRWIFFLNVPVGVISLLLTSRMVTDPPYLVAMRERARAEKHPVDFTGLALVALGFGALQVLLDKGQEDDWFASGFIRFFAFVSLTSLTLLVAWELRKHHPIVDLRLLGNRNFGLCNALLFLVGAILFASTVLLPLFEQTLLGYTAQKAGETLSVGGLVLLPLMPLVGWLATRISARWLVAFGFALCALALHMMTHINLGISFSVATTWRLVQALSLGFLFIPITTSSYVGLPHGKNEEASAILNLSRNLGGSVGIALMGSVVARRTQFHQDVLVARTSLLDPSFRATIARLQKAYEHGGAGTVRALRMAYASVYEELQRQATAMAYVDAFWILFVVSALAAGVALLLEANPRERKLRKLPDGAEGRPEQPEGEDGSVAI
jgi:DHA2 family multidrug resistance protein